MRSSRPEVDKTWLKVAKDVSEQSLCSRAKIGSVSVDKSGKIISTGYNGPPSGFDHKGLPCSHWCRRAKENNPTRDYSNCPAIHSEVNCILFADRDRLIGGTLYITSFMCIDCAKIIANSGILRVVVPADANRPEYIKPNESVEFLVANGIQVDICEV